MQATLCALKNSRFVKAVESVVEAVDCCRLLCTLESSRFIEAVESVVVKAVESVVRADDCCGLLCDLVLLKLLNLLLKMLIVVGYIMCSRKIEFCRSCSIRCC